MRNSFIIQMDRFVVGKHLCVTTFLGNRMWTELSICKNWVTDGLFGAVSFMVIKWGLLKQNTWDVGGPFPGRNCKPHTIQCRVPYVSPEFQVTFPPPQPGPWVSPPLGMKPPWTLVVSSSPHLSIIRDSPHTAVVFHWWGAVFSSWRTDTGGLWL